MRFVTLVVTGQATAVAPTLQQVTAPTVLIETSVLGTACLRNATSRETKSLVVVVRVVIVGQVSTAFVAWTTAVGNVARTVSSVFRVPAMKTKA